MKPLRLLLAFVLCGLMTVTTASAQTLVLHHVNGSTTNVRLNEQTSITLSGSNIVVDNVAYAQSDISRISYKPSTLQGDLNGDGAVDVGDIMSVINIMAAGNQPEASSVCPDDNHPHLIDLGLPSGTKWACCNVGAGTPVDYGQYYAWGETQTKSTYNWNTYLYGSTEYVNLGVDIAGTEYDAATASWGTPWQMPSQAQLQELLDNTTSTWTTLSGVNGLKFTGSNGNVLFLPAAGYLPQSELAYGSSVGNYRSSTRNNVEGSSTDPFSLYFRSDISNVDIDSRYYGQTVRPVQSVQSVQPVASSVCPDDNHPHWIDLGLPSGTEWCCCNMWASAPEDYGGRFTFDQVPSDAPTLDQIDELLGSCSSVYTNLNGVKGRMITGPNGNTIFLPAAGILGGKPGVSGAGSFGFYWSSTPYDEDSAYSIWFSGGSLNRYFDRRDYSQSVRFVRKN